MPGFYEILFLQCLALGKCLVNGILLLSPEFLITWSILEQCRLVENGFHPLVIPQETFIVCFMGRVLSGALIPPTHHRGLSNPSFTGCDFSSLWNTESSPVPPTIPLVTALCPFAQ